MPPGFCLALLLIGQGTPPEKPAAEPEIPTAKQKTKETRVPVAAIVVSEDDDSLPTVITPEEIKTWLADANAIYKSAKIQFDFNGDESDFVSVKSSALNQIVNEKDPTFATAATLGNRIAAKFPDKMTLIFRHGQGEIPSMTGFGSIENDFALLPQFKSARICNHQDAHYAAQVIGECLGLKPTAAQIFPTSLDAIQFLHDHKDDPNCFDGDGIKDTSPDPLIVSVEGICQPTGTVTLDGVDFSLPVGNLMSKYDGAKSLSPTQIKWAQWALRTRLKNGMRTPTNLASPPPFKVDALPIAEKKNCETRVETLTVWNAGRWNGKAHLRCDAKKAGSLTLTLTIEEEGAYRFAIYATQAPDFGITQTYLDDAPLGKPFDGWAPYTMPTGKIELGAMKLKRGPHRIRFVATDKYELSTDYHFALDSLSVQPVEK